MKGFWVALTAIFVVCLLWRPVQAQTASEPASLLITEVYYNTPGSDGDEEWIEIANVGTAVIDLSAYKVGDEEMMGGGEGMVRFPEEARIEPGQAVVVAQTAVGFRYLFGHNPDFEIRDTDPAVPDMRPYLIWASGDLALSNEGDEVLLVERTAVRDSLSYGDSTFFFQPAINNVLTGHSIERVPADCDTDSAAAWLPRETPTPGQLTFEGECLVPVDLAVQEILPPIGEIQGRGEFSPYVNQMVSFRGVVTGSYEDRNTRGVTYYTLFVQDAPGTEDGDPATSDGVALFLGRRRPFTQIGDLVKVTGLVTEFFGLTELEDSSLEITVEASGQPLPAPVSIDPPADNTALAAYYEPLEAMRVMVAGTAQVVGPTFSGCGFAVARPEYGLRFLQQRAADGIGRVIPILHTSDVDCTGFPNVKTGDTVSGLAGPLIYHFDQFKLVQQQPDELRVTAVPWPPLPAPLRAAAGQFSVSTVNLENHFDAIDDTGDAAEPKPDPTDIGLKQSKLAAAIGQTLSCPTLVGIQEVEKKALLDSLAAETAATCGFTYTVTHLESADVRGIDVALLSDPHHVQVQAAHLRQTCTELNTGIFDETAVCPDGQSPLFSRPPLQVDLTIDGQPFTVYVNHFKSKVGGAAETEAQRLAHAAHVGGLVDEQLAHDPEARLIVLGDLNDYELSPTLLALAGNGRLRNVLAQIPLAERYSYVYGGAAQLIDGLLVSPALSGELAGVTILHVNADYPDSLSRDVSPDGLLYKATDHDLPLAVFNLAAAPEPATAVPTLTPAPPAAEPAASSGGSWFWLLGMGGLGTAVLLALLVARRHQAG
ncbi:MAG: lamin tail domain-containing protein [Anaerolineales bacterium]|nr:lamin tail domain-containing protein [Anaerolineales bacterium]